MQFKYEIKFKKKVILSDKIFSTSFPNIHVVAILTTKETQDFFNV